MIVYHLRAAHSNTLNWAARQIRWMFTHEEGNVDGADSDGARR